MIRLRLPALRERREDVPLLTRFFLQQSARQLGVEPKRISDAALQQLAAFDFPGTVRQLENICHWLTVMAPAQVIETKDLPPEVAEAAEAGPLAAAVLPSAEVYARPQAAAELAPVQAVGELATPVVQAAASMPAVATEWEQGLQAEALALLAEGRTDVWDILTRRFETGLIQSALVVTRGRRIEAAQKLGIGRNTITRKIQELGLE